jgi:hypothetical protein
MSELLIRASMNDHLVLADLLAPSGPHVGRPISRVVVNAPDAARNERLVEVAAATGTPLLIDPLTILLQTDIDPTDAWVSKLSYGRADAVPAADLTNRFILDALVAEVVEFQVQHGATSIIPPYFYADDPESPAFEATLQAIGRTARRMRTDGVALPLLPILCVQLRSFAHRSGWQTAIDRFAMTAAEAGPQAIGLCLSPVGSGAESYAKVLDMIVAARHLRATGIPVIAWRQGVYGPALVAAGMDGYECGMGIGEQTNIPSFVGSRKPKSEPSSSNFAAHGTYIDVLGRSFAPAIARLLFDDRRLLGRLLCDSMRCCPHGSESMLARAGRPHAVRARARALAELDDIPNPAWKLHHIAKRAASAQVVGQKANEVLGAARVPNRVKLQGYEALERAADFLRNQDPYGARDSA